MILTIILLFIIMGLLAFGFIKKRDLNSKITNQENQINILNAQVAQKDAKIAELETDAKAKENQNSYRESLNGE